MRKLISILVALGVVLSFSLMATPAAAVEEPVDVYLVAETAKVTDNYTITFHNVGTVMGIGWIDIMFPTGSNTSTVNPACCELYKSKYAAAVIPYAEGGYLGNPSAPAKYVATEITSAVVAQVGDKDLTVRFWTAGGIIEKCDYVAVVVCNVTNPLSCNYHLEVGTSAHTPVDSEEYTIYCAKIPLVGGVNAVTGLDNMNLISLPCYPDDESIEVVLADLFELVEKTASATKPFSFSVWYWDNESDTWMKYVSDSSFTDLDTIEPGKAYWVKPSSSAVIKIHGDPYPPGQGPPLKWCYPRCWNMVGFASLTNLPASDYLEYTKIGPGYSNEAVAAIWGWDATDQWYSALNWTLTGGDAELEPGDGYWMAFLDEACIIPPPQSDC